MSCSYPALFPALKSAFSTTRENAINDMEPVAGENSTLEGELALLMAVAARDWSSNVRASALQKFTSIAARQEAPVALPLLDCAYHALQDPHPPTRVNAFAAVAAASPSPTTAFDKICAALVLETESDVRRAGFEALANLNGGLINGDKLLRALRRDGGLEAPVDMDVALSSGEYAGVLEDGVEACEPAVSHAALKAVWRIGLLHCGSRKYDVEREVVGLASRALRFSANSRVRGEALLALASDGNAELDSSCGRALLKEVRRNGSDYQDVLLKAMCTRRVADCGVFAELIRTLEVELVCARAAVESRTSEMCEGRVRFLSSLIVGFARCNIRWVHVVDLARNTSEKIAPFL